MKRESITFRFRRLERLSRGSFPALTVRYGRRLLVDYPDFGPAWRLVGTALVRLARYEEAEQAYSKAMEFCNPEYRQNYLALMGHLFFEAGDYDQAAEWYRKAIDSDPEDASYYIFLGAVLAKAGRFHEAVEVHRAATACAEGCIDEAYLNLGYVFRALERFHDAAECFREALRLTPDYRLARRALLDVERCIQFESSRD